LHGKKFPRDQRAMLQAFLSLGDPDRKAECSAVLSLDGPYSAELLKRTAFLVLPLLDASAEDDTVLRWIDEPSNSHELLMLLHFLQNVSPELREQHMPTIVTDEEAIPETPAEAFSWAREHVDSIQLLRPNGHHVTVRLRKAQSEGSHE
jgi:hypothetical protein